jgi:hypothetical protein
VKPVSSAPTYVLKMLSLLRFSNSYSPKGVSTSVIPCSYGSVRKGTVPPELLNLRQVHSERTSCTIPSELKNFRQVLIHTLLVLLSFLDNSIRSISCKEMLHTLLTFFCSMHTLQSLCTQLAIFVLSLSCSTSKCLYPFLSLKGCKCPLATYAQALLVEPAGCSVTL